ncbi:MAG TPA: hypothetical protein VGD58_28380 [Herpetosiphonaceae bacterium]
MPPRVIETHLMRQARLILDLEDSLVRERQGGKTHPRPFGSISVSLVARVREDGSREALAPPLVLVLQRSRSDYLLWFGLVKRGGPLLRVQLAGRYEVRIESAYYQPALRDDIVVPLANSAYFFDLKANEFHPLNH